MHDIDRTQLEATGLEAGLSSEQGELGELSESTPAAMESASESPLNELQEIELATELLEIGSEQELQQFLGNLAARVGKTVGSFVRSDTGQALAGILKGAARQALPVIGRGLGQWVSPDRGGRAGAAAGQAAARMLGLELEGLSSEDREFELARQFVRFAAAALRRAAFAPATLPAVAVARRAAIGAARGYAPGLLPRLQGRSSLLWPRGGRWVRRGRVIVLFGG